LTSNSGISLWEQTGLEVIDIDDPAVFAGRSSASREIARQLEGMQRIARAFVTEPETILQVLTDAAVELCGADSAGISLEKDDRTDESFYHWVATSGQYSGFLNAMLPRYPSACGICLERGRPQIFRVGRKFFEIMGVEAPLVSDGLLFPWQVESMRGTIFVMAHNRAEAFDAEDCRVMATLADFAGMAMRQQRQQRLLVEQAGAKAAAAMANRLAHRINNPLQSLTNLMYMAAEGYSQMDAKTLGQQASTDLQRLSTTVQQLLALPYNPAHKAK
jgi:hypothetical protein